MYMPRTLLLVALLAPSVCFAQAGRFLIAVGDVIVVRAGAETRASFGTAVQSGDTIRLGAASNAQIRMSDESIVSLRERTEFRIDEYFFSGRVDGREKSIFSLLAGGLRTVTGAIGNLRRTDKYAVRTATATVGIRGTHYTLRECVDDCFEAGASAASAPLQLASADQSDIGPLAQAPGPLGKPVPNGTYGGVTDGRIGVTNNAADREFGANEYFFVANQNTPPQGLLAPPGFLHDRLEGQVRTKGQKGRETGETLAGSGINAESRPSDVPAGPKPSDFVVTEQKTSTGSPTVIAGTTPTIGGLGYWATPGEFSPTGGGAFLLCSALSPDCTGSLPTSFRVPEGCIGPNDDCTGAPSGTLGAPVQSGSRTPPGATTPIVWGAWASGTITDGGVTFSLSSTTQAHLMYGPLTPADVIASKTGTMVFQSSLGSGLGTIPTNNFGATATSGSFPTITMDFTARTATFSSLSVNFPSAGGSGTQNWSFSGGVAGITIVAGQGAFFRGDATGSCSSGGMACNGTRVASATGRAAGIFLGPLGDHAGVVLSGSAGTSNFGTVRVYCPTC